MDKNTPYTQDIAGYEGLYAVTQDGRIWSYPKMNGLAKRKGHWMSLNEHNGYIYVSLCKNGRYKTLLVHRLVASSFLKKETRHCEVNHLNGIKGDNRVENLAWCTKSENSQHAYDTGLHVHTGLKGEKNPKSKLTAKDVLYIRGHEKLTKQDRKYLMKRFGIAKTTLSSIINRKSWVHI